MIDPADTTYREPSMRILDGRTTLAVFGYGFEGGTEAHWFERGAPGSKGRRDFLYRRRQEAAALPPAERAKVLRSSGSHSIASGCLTALIGDTPLVAALSALGPDRPAGPVSSIPGYRLVCVLPGLTLRAEVLFAALDRLREAGQESVQLGTLRAGVHRMS